MRRYPLDDPLARALDVVGARWTMLIIQALRDRPLRYNELLEALPGIATNLLAERLRELERQDVVVRRSGHDPVAPVRYELTSCGCELQPILEGLAAWAGRCASAE